MAARCGFELDVRAARERCATWLAAEYDYIHDDPPVDEIEAFADLRREDGVWRCPRTADHGDRCVFHAADAADDEVRAAVVAALRGEYDADDFAVDAPDGDYRPLATRLLGVELDVLDLHGWRHPNAGAVALDLRGAEIGTLRLGEASLAGPIRLDGATVGSVEAAEAAIGGSFGARFATVEGDLVLDRAAVDGRIDCRFATVGGDATLRHATAESRFDVGFAHVDGGVHAAGGVCGGRFTLKEAVVDAVAASGVTVSGPDPESDIPGLQFRGLTTAGSVDLTDADCEGQLIGYRMDIGGDFEAAEASITQGVSLGTRTGTRLGEASVEGSLSFSGATVGDVTKLHGRDRDEATLTVGGRVDLSGATFDDLRALPNLTHDRLSVVDCRDATIREGMLAQPEGSPLVYDLERAELGDVRIEPGEAPAPACLWLNRTTFAGFKFVDAARRGFERADWTLIDDSRDRRAAVAFGRAFREATEYARDVAALCVARPRLREWLRDTEPPYAPESLAAAVFDGVGERTVERVAKNGPETAEQLGPEPFERERYRVGVATRLARQHRRSETGDGDDLAAVLATAVGAELRALARAVGAGDDPERVDVSSLRDSLADALAAPDGVARTLEQQELTYIEARKGADDVGDSTAAGHFFVNELRVRRRIHRREGDHDEFLANLIFDWVAGYGERPWRALRSSTALVFGFAGVYWLLWRLLPGFSSATYAGADGAVLLSSASFTAFVLGGTNVESKPVRLLANFEALLGAFMIALFVFTLTRSLHR